MFIFQIHLLNSNYRNSAESILWVLSVSAAWKDVKMKKVLAYMWNQRKRALQPARTEPEAANQRLRKTCFCCTLSWILSRASGWRYKYTDTNERRREGKRRQIIKWLTNATLTANWLNTAGAHLHFKLIVVFAAPPPLRRENVAQTRRTSTGNEWRAPPAGSCRGRASRVVWKENENGAWLLFLVPLRGGARTRRAGGTRRLSVTRRQMTKSCEQNRQTCFWLKRSSERKSKRDGRTGGAASELHISGYLSKNTREKQRLISGGCRNAWDASDEELACTCSHGDWRNPFLMPSQIYAAFDNPPLNRLCNICGNAT